MRITEDTASFYQNKFNFHIGSIDTNETILIENNFIIIGDIKTSKSIFSEHNLIVIGNISAKSIYISKDLLCTGNVSTEISEVKGKVKILKENILNQYTKPQYTKSKKNNTINIESNNYDKDIIIKDNLEKKVESNVGKYKRINKEKDLENGDIVIHNSLGEGIFLGMYKNKLKIDFKEKGIRYISSDITFKLELLKKKINNEYQVNKESLDNSKNIIFKDVLYKNEYIKKIDDLINYGTKNQIKYATNYNKSTTRNNLYKTKPIIFYIKDINSYIIREYDKTYECHYIRYNDCVYIRLNQICDYLQISNYGMDKHIEDFVKVSYYGKCINGIKFISINDVYNILSYLKEKNNYHLDESKVEILIEGLNNILIDADKNLENAIPYYTIIIDNILKYNNLNIEELAQKWKVTVEHIEIIKSGYLPSMSKFKNIIKENKIENRDESKYEIRIINN